MARLVAALCVTASVFTWHEQAAFGYACSGKFYRAGVDSGQNAAHAVRSYVTLPTFDQLSGWGEGEGRASVTDVYINRLDQGWGFVQFGWYVGEGNASLPYVVSPHLFFGEANSFPNETLTAGPGISWGSTHSFKLVPRDSANGDYTYIAYLDGSQKFVSAAAHPSVDDPGFNGETDWDAVQMCGDAEDPAGDHGTLQYRDGNVWYYFDNQSTIFTPYRDYGFTHDYHSTYLTYPYSTDFAYGGGYCT